MRRPITVRWWFRVTLIAVVLIGGYGTTYVLISDVTIGPHSVAFEYRSAARRYAVSEWAVRENCLAHLREVELARTSEPDLLIPTYAPDYAWAFYVSSEDASAWWYRGFYVCERIELWLRGARPLGGEREQLLADLQPGLEELMIDFGLDSEDDAEEESDGS